MFHSIALLVTALVLFYALPATAQEEDDYARNGLYVGLAGTYAAATFEDEAEDAFAAGFGGPASANVDNSLGINGNIGYRFHPNLSAEVEVEWLDGFDVDFSVPGFGTVVKTDVEPVVITANVKGYLLTGRYQPFLLLGLGFMTAKFKAEDTAGLGLSFSDTFTDVAVRFGGGLDLYATENVVVNVGFDYVLPTGDVEDLDYVSIGWGFAYRF